MLESLRRALSVLSFCVAVALTSGLAAPPLAAAPPQAAKAKPAAPAEPIDINAAGEQELQSIPGIGEATARLIIEWREANGPFRSVEDLMKVKGIGEKSLEKLRPYVRVVKQK